MVYKNGKLILLFANSSWKGVLANRVNVGPPMREEFITSRVSLVSEERISM
jgi:hypothetical protein